MPADTMKKQIALLAFTPFFNNQNIAHAPSWGYTADWRRDDELVVIVGNRHFTIKVTEGDAP